MKKLKGLIPGQQQCVNTETAYWSYGIIENGEKKIDPLLHYGCFTLGYDRHDIIDYVYSYHKSIKPEIAERMAPDETLRLNHASFELTDRLYDLTGGYRSFFALSGSDANEGAVKLASAYHYQNKEHSRNKIISFTNSYHGSTMLTSSLGCDSLMINPFYSMSSYSQIERIDRDFEINDYNWLDVSCIVVETCSYSPLLPNSKEFWDKLSFIQSNYGVLIIVDDIFIGGGKTGHFVGWSDLPINPDIFTMGKAITGGTFPLSIVLFNEKVNQSLPENFVWEHGFTYSYSMPGVLSVLKYLDILKSENILEKHNSIKDTAKKCFENCNINVKNTFGLHFYVEKNEKHQLYLIPLTADDEYFYILEQNLKNENN